MRGAKLPLRGTGSLRGCVEGSEGSIVTNASSGLELICFKNPTNGFLTIQTKSRFLKENTFV
jgi:hypothetical protein